MQYNSRGRYVGRPPRTFKPKTPVNTIIPNGYQQVYNNLMSYAGTFPLLINLRSNINRYGKLTDKQWAAAVKCLTPKPTAANLVQAQPATCNIPITVTATAARRIGRNAKWPINPLTFTVTQLQSRTSRSYKVRARIDWDTACSVCRCCGRTLTDWRSQATGVGPVCVKRTNIPYVKTQADVAAFQQSMKTLVAQLGEVEFEIKSWHLTNGETALRNVVFPVTPTTTLATPNSIATTIVAIPIAKRLEVLFNISDCIWFESRRVLQVPKSIAQTKQDLSSHKSIFVYNTQTNTRVEFTFTPAIYNVTHWVYVNEERGLQLWVEKTE